MGRGTVHLFRSASEGHASRPRQDAGAPRAQATSCRRRARRPAGSSTRRHDSIERPRPHHALTRLGRREGRILARRWTEFEEQAGRTRGRWCCRGTSASASREQLRQAVVELLAKRLLRTTADRRRARSGPTLRSSLRAPGAPGRTWRRPRAARRLPALRGLRQDTRDNRLVDDFQRAEGEARLEVSRPPSAPDRPTDPLRRRRGPPAEGLECDAGDALGGAPRRASRRSRVRRRRPGAARLRLRTPRLRGTPPSWRPPGGRRSPGRSAGQSPLRSRAPPRRSASRRRRGGRRGSRAPSRGRSRAAGSRSCPRRSA